LCLTALYIFYIIFQLILNTTGMSHLKKSGSNHLRWCVVVGFATTYKHPVPVPPDIVLMCRSSLVRCACAGFKNENLFSSNKNAFWTTSVDVKPGYVTNTLASQEPTRIIWAYWLTDFFHFMYQKWNLTHYVSGTVLSLKSSVLNFNTYEGNST